MFSIYIYSSPYWLTADHPSSEHGAKHQNRKPLPERGRLRVRSIHLLVNASIFRHAKNLEGCDLMCVHEILCRFPIRISKVSYTMKYEFQDAGMLTTCADFHI